MHMRYRILAILLCVLAGLMTACGKDTGDEKAGKNSGYVLYYLNEREDGLKEVPYDLKNENDPEKASSEILYQLSHTDPENTQKYKPAIYEGIFYQTVSLKDGKETIDFGSSYQELTSNREILLRTAVVKSLIQIEGVDSVTFTVNGGSLLTKDQTPVGAMNETTFLTSQDELYTQTQSVKLYYSNKEGDGLVEVEETITADDNTSLEMKMLKMLQEEPVQEDAKRPLPVELEINKIQIMDNICYVDLNSAIEDTVPGVEDRVKVFAMVNTLTSLGGVSSVQFTIDGKTQEKVNSINHFDRLQSFDYSLCMDTKE